MEGGNRGFEIVILGLRGFEASGTEFGVVGELLLWNAGSAPGTGANALRAEGPILDRFEAAGAATVVAGIAPLQTISAAVVRANGTRTDAGIAEVGVAGLAGVAFVGVGRSAALPARSALPVIERDVRRLRVVSGQHGTDEQEGIGQPAFAEGIVQGLGGIAGTEFLIADVRMGHFVLPLCGIGIEGDQIETAAPRHLTDSVPGEDEGEPAQGYVLERNRIGMDLQGTRFPIDLSFIEFVVDLLEFSEPVIEGKTVGWFLLSARLFVESVLQQSEDPTQIVEGGVDFAVQVGEHQSKAMIVGEPPTVADRLKPTQAGVEGLPVLVAGVGRWLRDPSGLQPGGEAEVQSTAERWGR